jgi:hypothetical protein
MMRVLSAVAVLAMALLAVACSMATDKPAQSAATAQTIAPAKPAPNEKVIFSAADDRKKGKAKSKTADLGKK